jgi:hypothetical protein
MPQLRQLVTSLSMVAKVQSQAIKCEICGEQSGIGTSFSSRNSACRFSVSFRLCLMLIHHQRHKISAIDSIAK